MFAKGSLAMKEAEALAHRGVTSVQANFPAWHVGAQVGVGSPAWELVMRADKWKPNLIVVGSHGRIGSGAQYMSWIAIDDAVAVILRALDDENMSGIVNTVAPRAVTNAEFTETLGRVLHRPTAFTVPAFAARLAFGEMADAVLLGGQRVVPAKLEAIGYEFKHPELEGALRHLLAETDDK